MEDGVLKKLTAIGNSKGIILDRTLLQILDVPEDATHVELRCRTAESSSSAQRSTPDAFGKLSRKMLAAHRRAFKRLADS